MAEGIPNLHKSMTDSQLHVPRGFAGALADTHMEKSLTGLADFRDVRWYKNFYNRPVLKLVDGALTPPTEVDLDRYILLQLTGTTVHADWDGAGFNDIVQLDATISGGSGNWETGTPEKGYQLYDCETLSYQSFNGTKWGSASTSFEGIRIGDTEYTDISTAIGAVGSGEVITIPAGTYAEGDLFSGANVSDFDIHFGVGAVVNAPAGTEAVFDTSSLPGAADINITGYGEFNKATDAGFRGIVYANNNADVLSVEALDMDSNGNTTVWVEDAAGTAVVDIRIRSRANSDGGGVFYSASGKLNIDASEAVESTGGDVVLTDNAQSEVNAVFDRVEGGYTGIGGVMLITTQRAFKNYVTVSAGTVSINGVKAELKAGTATKMISNAGATLRYNVLRTEMDIATGTEVLNHSSGTTQLISLITNQRNIATADAINVSGAGLTLRYSTVEVTHPDALAIRAAAPQDVVSDFTNYNAGVSSDVTYLEGIRIGGRAYSDFDEAKEAAQVGDVIRIPSGLFLTQNNLLKDGVGIHFEPNSGVNYLSGGDVGAPIFYDLGLTLPVSVTGYGEFTNSRVIGDSEAEVFRITVVASGNLQFKKALSLNGFCYFGSKEMIVSGDMESNGNNCVRQSAQPITFLGSEIKSTAGRAVSITGVGGRIKGTGSLISTTSVGYFTSGESLTLEGDHFQGFIQGSTIAIERDGRALMHVSGILNGGIVNSGGVFPGTESGLTFHGTIEKEGVNVSIQQTGLGMTVLDGYISSPKIECSDGILIINGYAHDGENFSGAAKNFDITGGLCIFNSQYREMKGLKSTISGGEFQMNGEMVITDVGAAHVALELSGGATLVVKGRIHNLYTDAAGHCIGIVGAASVLRLKGAELIKTDAGAKDIAPDTAATPVVIQGSVVTNRTVADGNIVEKGGLSIIRNADQV